MEVCLRTWGEEMTPPKEKGKTEVLLTWVDNGLPLLSSFPCLGQGHYVEMAQKEPLWVGDM